MGDPMRVVVTGAAGFLGRHVAKSFHDDGWTVRGFDLEAVDLGTVETVVGNLTELDSVLAATEGADVIAHVGAIGDVYLAGEQPGLAAEVNVLGSSNVAVAAERHGARVIYASTWEVYGEPEYQPIDEDHPTRPDHPYNITKLAGESLLLAAGKLRGIEVIALRLGTAYGSGIRPNSVFRIFLDRARLGEPLTIQGDGSQGRQFTHATDIARAFLLASTADSRNTVLNIVAPEMISIKELAEHVIARHPTEVSFGPSRPGDVPPALVSAQRALDVLGWKAEIPFAEGFEEFSTGAGTVDG